MNLVRIAARVYIATNQSLAYEIREQILKKILSLFPSGTFEDKLYDTNEGGKGFRPGYVSFALKPLVWSNNDLIGGILIRCTYPSNVVKSDSPESNSPEYKLWKEQGGNKGLVGGGDEIINLEAGYYNKKSSGSFQREQALGDAIFTINNLEEISELELSDEQTVQSGIDAIVQDVLKDPPELAISHERKVKNNQYTSLRKFVDYIRNEGRNKVKPSEIKLLSDSTGQNLIKLTDKLKNLGISVG